MPYQWVEPEVALEYFGVKIYHVYRNNHMPDKREYVFTTAKHEDFEVNVYEFDVRNINTWEANGHDIDKTIKWCIEHQCLKMPTRIGIDYPFKRGSFNWYIEHPNKCINKLAWAMMKADRVNQVKMYRMFPHMGNANQMRSWKTPYLKGVVIDKPGIEWFENRNKESRDETIDIRMGSFYWYRYRSGSFVTHLANAILYADRDIVEIIRTEYPQMVAAAEWDSWHMAPTNFAAVYNAEEHSGSD